MKLKKFIAGVMATALVGTTLAMSSAMTANAVADTYTAKLQGSLAQMDFWDGNSTTCTVSGDGSYSLALTCGEASEITDGSICLIIGLDFNVYDVSTSGSLSETGIVIDITSVDVDGNSLNYSGSSSNDKAYRVDDDGKTIRHNIYNTWSGGQETQDITVPFTVEEGSVVTVNFNISGLTDAIHKAKVLAGEISDEDETEAPTTTANNSDSSTTTTTAKAGDTTTASTTKNGDSTTVAEEDTTTATGDAGIAGIVLVCALTGAGVVATRKRG